MSFRKRDRYDARMSVSPNFRLLLLQCGGTNATIADRFVDWVEDAYVIDRKFELDAEPTELFEEFIEAEGIAP